MFFLAVRVSVNYETGTIFLNIYNKNSVLHSVQNKYVTCGCSCALVTQIGLKPGLANFNQSEGHITR